MSRSIAPRLLGSSICASCRARVTPSTTPLTKVRAFSTTLSRRADDPPSKGINPSSNPFTKSADEPYNPPARGRSRDPSAPSAKPRDDLVGSSWFNRKVGTENSFADLEGLENDIRLPEDEPPYKMYVYAHKHNTHITLAAPPYEHEVTGRLVTKNLISLSCGNIGFRKSGRSSYDAAYQLAAFVMAQIQHRGWEPQIKRLEMVFRGFGQGREAVSKALLGLEGKGIRDKVVSVTDSTRLKFGGTRSRATRRLG